MLTTKIVYLKKIYNFDFDHFLIKRTVFVLSTKNGFHRIKTTIFRSNYARSEKKLTSKIVYIRKIYKFDFDHFLAKRTIFVLSIKNGFHKIKKSILRSNYRRYEKMLTSKIVHLNEIYNFDFDYFLIKRTDFFKS